MNKSVRFSRSWVEPVSLCSALLLGHFGLQSAQAAQTIALEDEVAVTFTIPPGTYSNDFYFEVADGTSKFRLDLNGGAAVDGNLDLFLRFGEPFPETNAYALSQVDAGSAFTWLHSLSHYQSTGLASDEFLVITEHNLRPPTAGRWHLAVANFSAVPIEATLQLDLRPTEGPSVAQIIPRFDLGCTPEDGPECVCDASGWTDPTPVLPIGGNNGTTLGEQRRLAMLEAMSRLSRDLRSEVPLVIRACWAPLSGDANSGVLARFDPVGYYINDPGLFFGFSGQNPVPSLRSPYLPESGAWYPQTVMAKLGGTSTCRLDVEVACDDHFDASVTFNILVDTPAVFSTRTFDYGLQPANGVIDFITQAMHMVTHQLGFQSLLTTSPNIPNRAQGSEALGRDDIYERQILATSIDPPQLFSRLSNSERVAAMTSETGLQWISPDAVASRFNLQHLRPGEPGVRMYARGPLQPGLNYLHLDTYYTLDLMAPGSLLTPARDLNLAKPMLEAVGWNAKVRSYPVSPAPFVGQWYERDRAGHGIDFQRVYTSAEGYDIYSLIFYTYDAIGEPEWFLAIGPMIDGVFVADNNELGQSLVAYQYQEGRFPPQRADPLRAGHVRLDFNQSLDSFACSDGTDREGVSELAVFAWAIDGVTGNWCMEPLIAAADRTGVDPTGTWYAGADDQGWGASIARAERAAGELLFALVYYPDAQGRGRWAFALTEDYVPGQSMTLFERRGYCRTCAATELVDTPAGSIELSVRTPTQEDLGAGNLVGFSASFQGAGGGQFTRPSGTPITLLSAPAPEQEPQ